MTNEAKYDCLKLERQLCFPLYAAAKEVVRQYRPLLKDLDLTYTQYICMMVLWEHKKMNVSELGQHLMLDSGTLTPLLKKLEQKGLVTRKRGEADEREVMVTLTKAGEKLKDKAVNIPQELRQCLNLSLEESTQLYQLLYKILK